MFDRFPSLLHALPLGRLLLLGLPALAACASDPEFDCETEDASWSTDLAADEEAMLAEVNRIRGEGTECVGEALAAAPELSMDADLRCAARAHSRWMAEGGFFDHVSPAGSQPWDRVDRVGYTWTVVAENIAAGDADPVSTTASLFESTDGHCENLMNPRTTEAGIGLWVDAVSEFGVYWTQLVAAP